MRDGRENVGKAWFSARTVLCLGKISTHSKAPVSRSISNKQVLQERARGERLFLYVNIFVCVCVCAATAVFQTSLYFLFDVSETSNTKLCNCEFDIQVVLEGFVPLSKAPGRKKRK